eukprot:CAMPEP_0194041164 /NCGR_PEP_ID=MMETSP0009_2-20130614/13053_1 /TAXON_ID=210454 /ORGANISM="Grammatophora oceanica, Strain CCMP 410" /LENGTH=388 /DNA_ID=CAMNT_0038684543 /DNA_START=172 /DNA_END=1338 /DNA_ORIENTATION=+
MPFRRCVPKCEDAAAGERAPLLQSRSISYVGVVPAMGRRGLTTDFTDFTHSEQMVALCVANLILYLIAGVVSFSFIFEDWSVVDSLYYSCVTFTTVGYGDLFPTTDGGRIFNIFFALYGIVILGLFIGLLGESVVERCNQVQSNFEAKARKQTIKMFGVSRSGELKSIQEGDEDEEDDDEDDRDLDREEESVLQFVWNTVVLELPIVMIILLLAVGIGSHEGWSIVDALYYGVITSSTVGYGDIVPDTQAMRIACIFFIPVSVAVFCEILGRIAGSYLERRTIRKEKEFLGKQLTRMDLELMDTDQNGSVEYAEFLTFMLVAMQKVDPEDIDELKDIFQKLDKDKSGSLDKNDLMLRKQKSSRRLFAGGSAASFRKQLSSSSGGGFLV